MSDNETKTRAPAVKFNDEQIKEIRALRAERDENGKPVHSHKALGDRFGTSAGRISHIVRNLSHKDPDYVPVNDHDGNPGRGKRVTNAAASE